MDGAALPGAVERLRDRGLEPGVRVGDDQLHTVEPALDQAAEEAAPERLGLALADVEADHLPVAGLVHGVGKHERLRHDASHCVLALAALHPSPLASSDFISKRALLTDRLLDLWRHGQGPDPTLVLQAARAASSGLASADAV